MTRHLHAATIALGLALGVLAIAATHGCSASAVRVQAATAHGTTIVNNTALDVLAGPEAAVTAAGVYNAQVIEVARTACGHTKPCADPEAARDAVNVVRARWAPVWSAWALAGVALAGWRAQLMRCQRGRTDGGTECTVSLEQMQATALAHLTTVRCALRGIHVTDPFPGAVSCPDSKAADAAAELEGAE